MAIRRATREELERYQEGDTLPGGGSINPFGQVVGGRTPARDTNRPQTITDPVTGQSFRIGSSGTYERSYDQAPVGEKSSSDYGYNVDGNLVPFRNDEVAIRAGYYGEDAAENIAFRDAGILEYKRLDEKESAGVASKYGLTGIAEDAFVGLSPTQATIRAQQIQREKQSQTSSLTSGAFNPETIFGTQKTINDFSLKLDDINDNPFKVDDEKQMEKKGALETTANEISKLFQSSQDFLNQYQSNPQLQQTLKPFVDQGGDINSIAQRADKTPVVTQGQYTVDQYLGELNTAPKQRAYESLIPENRILQDQIAQQAGIAQQHKDLYFGTQDQIGLIEQKRILAEEKIKILEKQEKVDERNLKKQANLAIQKNNAQMDREQAQIEENRLAAKNYTTGMLAKLGALKTTDAAVEGLAKLEQKYQLQSQQLRTAYDLSNKSIELQFQERLDNLELQTDSNILKVQEDLTLDEEKVAKEIIKIQNDALEESYKLMSSFANKFRTQTDKYTKEAKALADKNAKDFASMVGEYDFGTFTEYMNKNSQPTVKYNFAEKKKEFLPGFIDQAIASGELSSETENVLSGSKDITSYVPATQTKIRAELKKLGVSLSDLKLISGENGLDEFGKITASEQSKAINYIYANSDNPEEDIANFKKDRRFQAYILNQI